MEIKAVLCIIGSMLINLTLGTFYSIGNVVPYVISYMRNNGNPDIAAENATWVTAAYLLGQGTFMFIGSSIENSYGSRVASIIGCIVHSTSTLLTRWILDANFFLLVLFYGFGCGSGCGLAYIASIIAAQKWFPQNKGISTGFVVGSFGLGGLVFSPLQTLYMNPDNLPSDSKENFDPQVYSKAPDLFLYMSMIYATMQTLGCILAAPGPSIRPNQSTEEQNVTSTPAVRVTDDEILPRPTSFISCFQYKIFYVIGMLMMLVAPGLTFINSLGKTYGLTYIKDDRFLATILAVASIPNAIGRLTWGYLVERFGFRVCFTAKVLLISTLIAIFPYSFILSSKTLYAIWMLGLFFSFSASFVLFPVFNEQIFGPKYHGMVYGFLYIFLAVSSVITAVIIQLAVGPALKAESDPLMIRIVPCTIIASLYLISLLAYYLLLPTRKLERAIRCRTQQDMERTKNTLFHRQDLYPFERKTPSDIFQRDNSLGSIVRFKES